MIPNHNLNKLLRILLLSSVEHDCYELRRILRGTSLDETVLVEIIFTRTLKHIRAVKETYQRCEATLQRIELIREQSIFSSVSNHVRTGHQQ